MLSRRTIDAILGRLPGLTIGVVGDLFLDRYLDIDGALTEPSIETGLDAYQVVRVRSYPGAAGTVINNLAALGVGRVVPIAVIGDDGEGYELKQSLRTLRVVDDAWLFADSARRTPTYTKPMMNLPGTPARELNRLDIKNRAVLAAESEAKVLTALGELWPRVDALVVLDQVSEEDCGVVTRRVRARLSELGQTDTKKLVLADSRERIGLFRHISLKPNLNECLEAAGLQDRDTAMRTLVAACARAVFCTCGIEGIYYLAPGEAAAVRVPGYEVSGPIDTVGAGDSTSAGMASALAAGATPHEAAAFGNLVASITIQQVGTTGTASPEQVRRRWEEVNTKNTP